MLAFDFIQFSSCAGTDQEDPSTHLPVEFDGNLLVEVPPQ